MASELTPKLVTCQVPNLHKQKRPSKVVKTVALNWVVEPILEGKVEIRGNRFDFEILGVFLASRMLLAVSVWGLGM